MIRDSGQGKHTVRHETRLTGQPVLRRHTKAEDNLTEWQVSVYLQPYSFRTVSISTDESPRILGLIISQNCYL